MSAFVSLAFKWSGSLDDCTTLDKTLEKIGLHALQSQHQGEGMRESDWILEFSGENLALTCRCYDEEGWVSSTIDIDEELFENIGEKYGREKLVQTFIRLGAELLRQLNLRYVFFDEEAEAEVDPTEYNPNYLFGITLIADSVPGLDEASERPDIRRVEKFAGGVVLFRRLDPVPHYQPNT
jgi:hypothetical protein